MCPSEMAHNTYPLFTQDKNYEYALINISLNRYVVVESRSFIVLTDLTYIFREAPNMDLDDHRQRVHLLTWGAPDWCKNRTAET